jgi:hypothetical protein
MRSRRLLVLLGLVGLLALLFTLFAGRMAEWLLRLHGTH